MPDEELLVIIKQAVTDSGASSKQIWVKLWVFVMKAVAGRADGTRVKAMVESLLGVFVFVFVAHLFGAESAQASISYVDMEMQDL